jgi:hypothetical protein
MKFTRTKNAFAFNMRSNEQGQCHEKKRQEKTRSCKARKPDEAKAISVEFATQERGDGGQPGGGYLPPLG